MKVEKKKKRRKARRTIGFQKEKINYTERLKE
jgi:hypothetical protein